MTSTAEEAIRRRHGRSTLAAWLFSTDNVRVGILWVAATLLFFYLGGFAAILIRSELAFPGQTFLSPNQYNAYFTLHGTMMTFFFAVPVFFGIGSILVPGMIGTTNLAFPRLNQLDFWLILTGGLVLEAGFLLGQRPMAGWTSYTPLSLMTYSPGHGQDWWLWGVLIETVGGTLAGVNFAVTILRNRRPGLRLRRMPILVWTVLFTSFLTLVAGPALITALVMMFLDRNLGTVFFDATSVHATLLWQDLFWFYSHPATYVMALPAFGVVSMILPRFTKRPLLSYRAIVAGIGAITILSFLVWWHHMLVTGMHVWFQLFGAAATWLIAVPTGTIVFTWLLGMRLGSIRFTTPMLFALGWIVMFTIGGIDGLYMAYVPIDHLVHDTYWLVAHLHYIIFSGSVLGIFAAIYYWFPGALHVMLNEPLGKLHFWGTFVGMNMTFFPMHLLGMLGMPRRVHDYAPELHFLNFIIAGGMFVVAASMLLFPFNVFIALRDKRRLAHDPWGHKEEWNLTNAPEAPEEGHNVESVHMTHPQPHSDAQSHWPALGAAGLVLLAVGLVVAGWLAVLGLGAIALAVAGVAREVNPPRRAHAAAPPADDAQAREAPDFWRRFPPQAWLGVGISISAGMAYVAILRAFSAHGLFHPATWPPVAQDLATPAAVAGALAMAGSGVAALVGAGLLRRGDRTRGLALLGAALLLGAGFLATLVLEWVRLWSTGFTLNDGAAASGYYVLTSYHALAAVGGLVILGIFTWHAVDDRLREKRDSVLAGTLAFWTFAAASWIVTFAIIHLRVVVWEGRALI